MFSKKSGEEEQTLQSGNAGGLMDYDIYVMTPKEKLLYIALAAAVIYAVGYIFYHSHLFSALLTPMALFFPKRRTRQMIEKRKHQLNLQFRDMLYSLSSSLSAGKSVESAFRDVLKDLSIIYPSPETPIIREVEYIVKKVELNETIEEALADFARRSHLEDIENFVDVFQTCKRSGGNIVEVIKSTSDIINDKIEIKQEIGTLLSERKFEQKVLNIMPIAMVLLLSTTASDYIAPVFVRIEGRIAMTIAIVLFLIAYVIAEKIMKIEV